jgi:hypothetical protein
MSADVVHAAEPPAAKKEQAERLKKEGFERFGAGDYAAGIDAMEKAYGLVPAPGYLLNIAFAYDLWGGHCAEGMASFQRFFDACKDKVCADIPKASERFGRLRDKCNVVLAVKTDPPGASIRLDGTERGVSPVDISCTAGSHDLVATLPGYKDGASQVTLEEGKSKSVDIKLEALSPAAAAPAVTPPPPSSTPPPAVVATTPPPAREEADGGATLWILLGVGAAAVAGGVALAFVLGSKEPDPYGGSLGAVFEKGK